MKLVDFARMRSTDILKTLNFTTPPFDPFEIASSMGVKVDTSLDWDKVKNIKDGKIYLDEGNPVIWINPLAPINRQNFTLAHELGHLVYDVLPNLDKFQDESNKAFETLYRNNNQSPIETRANKFAANILMPISSISDVLTNIKAKDVNTTTDQYIDGLSSVFKVSKQAIIVRLKSLNVISEDYLYSYV